MEIGGGPEVCVRKERMAVLLPGKSTAVWVVDVQCFVDAAASIVGAPLELWPPRPRNLSYHVMCSRCAVLRTLSVAS